jgi:hypothetical protein
MEKKFGLFKISNAFYCDIFRLKTVFRLEDGEEVRRHYRVKSAFRGKNFSSISFINFYIFKFFNATFPHLSTLLRALSGTDCDSRRRKMEK